MKTWALRLALLLLYCVPFAFLSVNGDATSRTMIFYVLMVIGFAGLCWGALKTNNIPIIYIGNVLSFVSSYIVAKLSVIGSNGLLFQAVYGLFAYCCIINSCCYLSNNSCFSSYSKKEKGAVTNRNLWR